MQSIRRDVNALSEAGLCRCCHDGAAAPKRGVNLTYAVRRTLSLETTQKIAVLAAPLTDRVMASVFMGERTQMVVDVGDTESLIMLGDPRQSHQVGDTEYMQVDPRDLLSL